MFFDSDAIGRILAATALGAAVGLEREVDDQPAGLRTHITVCLGAALFGVISTLGFSEFETTRNATNIQVDPTRVASQVVVGVGFLGAGIIFRAGGVVRNVTTAASLWAVAAIGLACGVGDIGTGTVACGILLVALLLLRPLRTVIRERAAHDKRRMRLVLASGAPPEPVIDAITSLAGVKVDGLTIAKEDGAYVVFADLRAHARVNLSERLSLLAARDDVSSLGEV
jgi:putative Mg2+ transporter-C (MgtC) family protein